MSIVNRYQAPVYIQIDIERKTENHFKLWKIGHAILISVLFSFNAFFSNTATMHCHISKQEQWRKSATFVIDIVET